MNKENEKGVEGVSSKKAELISKIDGIWDEVLFDGDETINCCAIPDEMLCSIKEQIVDVLFNDFSDFYSKNYMYWNDALLSKEHNSFYMIWSRKRHKNGQ